MIKNNFQLEKGFGLIELMVSMALGLFLITGAFQVLSSSQFTYRLNNEVVGVQENARFALNQINEDIRLAGFVSCGKSSSLTNILNPVVGVSGWQYDFSQPVSGWDGDDADNYPVAEFPTAYFTVLSGGVRLPGSDLMTIRRGASVGDVEIADHTIASAVITGEGDNTFVVGDIFIITDCDKTAVFQHVGSTGDQLEHKQTGSISPGNCTNFFTFPKTCPNVPANAYTFLQSKGAHVFKAKSHAYFIQSTANNVPALFRRELISVGGNSTVIDHELVQGVENVQVFYGIDVDADGFANHYIDADQIPKANWGNVVSVRLHFLLRSTIAVTSEPQSFRFVGTSYTPIDNFLRQEFITTIALRNK